MSRRGLPTRQRVDMIGHGLARLRRAGPRGAGVDACRSCRVRLHRARRRLAAGELRRAQARRGAPGARLRGALRAERAHRASSSGWASSPERLPAEAFALTPSRKGARDRGRRRAGPRLRRAGGGRGAAERHAPRGDPRPARGAAPRVPRRQVQHALGHLPAQLGPRPALRHGARRPVLGGLSRHAGREPLQRDQPVDAAPVHLHDPAAELPRGEPVDARAARGVAAALPRDLPHGEGARARHLRRALEHLRERGLREGARRRQGRTSTRTTTCRATRPRSSSATCARA